MDPKDNSGKQDLLSKMISNMDSEEFHELTNRVVVEVVNQGGNKLQDDVMATVNQGKNILQFDVMATVNQGGNKLQHSQGGNLLQDVAMTTPSRLPDTSALNEDGQKTCEPTLSQKIRDYNRKMADLGEEKKKEIENQQLKMNIIKAEFNTKIKTLRDERKKLIQKKKRIEKRKSKVPPVPTETMSTVSIDGPSDIRVQPTVSMASLTAYKVHEVVSNEVDMNDAVEPTLTYDNASSDQQTSMKIMDDVRPPLIKNYLAAPIVNQASLQRSGQNPASDVELTLENSNLTSAVDDCGQISDFKSSIDINFTFVDVNHDTLYIKDEPNAVTASQEANQEDAVKIPSNAEPCFNTLLQGLFHIKTEPKTSLCENASPDQQTSLMIMDDVQHYSSLWTSPIISQASPRKRGLNSARDFELKIEDSNLTSVATDKSSIDINFTFVDVNHDTLYIKDEPNAVTVSQEANQEDAVKIPSNAEPCFNTLLQGLSRIKTEPKTSLCENASPDQQTSLMIMDDVQHYSSLWTSPIISQASPRKSGLNSERDFELKIEDSNLTSVATDCGQISDFKSSIDINFTFVDVDHDTLYIKDEPNAVIVYQEANQEEALETSTNVEPSLNKLLHGSCHIRTEPKTLLYDHATSDQQTSLNTSSYVISTSNDLNQIPSPNVSTVNKQLKEETTNDKAEMNLIKQNELRMTLGNTPTNRHPERPSKRKLFLLQDGISSTPQKSLKRKHELETKEQEEAKNNEGAMMKNKLQLSSLERSHSLPDYLQGTVVVCESKKRHSNSVQSYVTNKGEELSPEATNQPAKIGSSNIPSTSLKDSGYYYQFRPTNSIKVDRLPIGFVTKSTIPMKATPVRNEAILGTQLASTNKEFGQKYVSKSLTKSSNSTSHSTVKENVNEEPHFRKNLNEVICTDSVGSFTDDDHSCTPLPNFDVTTEATSKVSVTSVGPSAQAKSSTLNRLAPACKGITKQNKKQKNFDKKYSISKSTNVEPLESVSSQIHLDSPPGNSQHTQQNNRLSAKSETRCRSRQLPLRKLILSQQSPSLTATRHPLKSIQAPTGISPIHPASTFDKPRFPVIDKENSFI